MSHEAVYDNGCDLQIAMTRSRSPKALKTVCCVRRYRQAPLPLGRKCADRDETHMYSPLPQTPELCSEEKTV